VPSFQCRLKADERLLSRSSKGTQVAVTLGMLLAPVHSVSCLAQRHLDAKACERHVPTYGVMLISHSFSNLMILNDLFTRLAHTSEVISRAFFVKQSCESWC
jgi:hypothetical protein